MEKYIGTKIIEAEPAYRCSGRGGNFWVSKSDVKDIQDWVTIEEGYEVRYPDGYTSWSPKDVFEEAYRRTDGLTFGLAIEAAKKGHKIARRGWNGKNQYVELATDISYTDTRGAVINAKHDAIRSLTFAFAFVATSGVQLGWLASQADMLADDWQIVL